MGIKKSNTNSKKSSLLSNSSSLVASRLVQSVSAFILIASIARTLGTVGIGQYTLAFSYYLVFMTLVSAGFKTLFTREIAREPTEASKYLVSGTFLQFLFSMCGYALMLIVVALMPYPQTTTLICYVFGLAIFPFSLSNVTEAIFQAQERMHLIAICTIPVYIIRTLISILALSVGRDVIDIATIFVVSEVIIFILQCLLVQRLVKPQWKVDKAFIWKTIKSARTFLAIEGISVFRERMQIFILSIFASEGTVGILGSVLQLMQPSQIISNSVVLASFPSMSKAISLERKYKLELTEKTTEMLLFVAFPMFIGFLFLGKDLLFFVYEDENFSNAALVLCIVAFSMITRAFNQPLSYTLVANHLERVNLFEVINGTILGGILTIALVSKFELIGAALSILLVKIIAFSVYFYSCSKHLFTLRLHRVFTRPLIVSALMTGVFWCALMISPHFLISLIGVTFAYCVIMACILLGTKNKLNKIPSS